MKIEKDWLEQFESIEFIEPSEGWDKQVLQELNQFDRSKKDTLPHKMLLLGVVCLFILNIVGFSKNWHQGNKLENGNALKEIAAQFFIYTSSAKY